MPWRVESNKAALTVTAQDPEDFWLGIIMRASNLFCVYVAHVQEWDGG